MVIFVDFWWFFVIFCKIGQDKSLIAQKWRPGRWNWKFFWILEIKLVIWSAIFIKIRPVTMEEIKLEVWCFLDRFLHIGVINQIEMIYKILEKYIVNMPFTFILIKYDIFNEKLQPVFSPIWLRYIFREMQPMNYSLCGVRGTHSDFDGLPFCVGSC